VAAPGSFPSPVDAFKAAVAKLVTVKEAARAGATVVQAEREEQARAGAPPPVESEGGENA
jgi:hypothetical protein